MTHNRVNAHLTNFTKFIENRFQNMSGFVQSNEFLKRQTILQTMQQQVRLTEEHQASINILQLLSNNKQIEKLCAFKMSSLCFC